MATTYQLMQDTFQSFTGADIQAIATFRDSTGNPAQKVIGTLSSLTVSVVREVNPLWGMGSPDFRAVSRGKRSVSGTLTFIVLDRDPLVRDLVGISAHSQLTELRNQYLVNAEISPGVVNQFVNADLYMPGGYEPLSPSPANRGNQAAVAGAIQSLYRILGSQPLRYADQLAPFDITVSLINDQGAASVASVRQIYVVSQGTGWSMHDLESDQVYSFIARYYEPLRPLVYDVEQSMSWSTSSLS